MTPVSIPIATDVWTANYPAKSAGSCEAAEANGHGPVWRPLALATLGGVLARRSRKRAA